MSKRINKLDRLIYADIKDVIDGDNLVLSYEVEGFSEIEVESRLKHLASIGAIRINEVVGQTTVTAITQSGRDFFNAIAAE